MIDPDVRNKFELSGVDIVRFTVLHGGFGFGPENIKEQAWEWIVEQTQLNADKEKTSLAQKTSMSRWTIIGALSAIIAAIASIITLFQGN